MWCVVVRVGLCPPYYLDSDVQCEAELLFLQSMPCVVVEGGNLNLRTQDGDNGLICPRNYAISVFVLTTLSDDTIPAIPRTI
jgi:hypothetical protein